MKKRGDQKQAVPETNRGDTRLENCRSLNADIIENVCNSAIRQNQQDIHQGSCPAGLEEKPLDAACRHSLCDPASVVNPHEDVVLEIVDKLEEEQSHQQARDLGHRKPPQREA